MKYSTFRPLRIIVLSSLMFSLLLTGCDKEEPASSIAESSAATSSSAEAVSPEGGLIASLTEEELSQLISGKITLTQIDEQRRSAQTLPEDPAASDTSSTGIGLSGSTAPAESGSASRPTYEAELQRLLQQLYDVKARSESSLNSIIDSAKAEYKALPEEKQTSTRKVTIVMGKTSELRKLQSSCDKEVDTIIQQMRTLLTENGQSTALADEAQASYEAQKKEMIDTLTEKLYS